MRGKDKMYRGGHGFMVAIVVLFCTGSAGPVTSRPPRASADEAAWAREVLVAARGAPRILCGLASRAVEAHFGTGPWVPPAAAADTSSALHWALEYERTAAAIPVLLDGLASDDPCVRGIAARLIARARSAVAASGLLRALTEPAAGTRAAAATALGLGDIVAATDPLIDRLGDTDTDVRAIAARAATMGLARHRADRPPI